MWRVKGFVEGEVLLGLRSGGVDAEMEWGMGLGFVGVELLCKGKIIRRRFTVFIVGLHLFYIWLVSIMHFPIISDSSYYRNTPILQVEK